MDVMGMAGMAFVLVLFLLVAVVLVVVIQQSFATKRARASAAREEAYQKLAEDSAANGRRIAEELGELRARVTSMEKLLREVE